MAGFEPANNGVKVRCLTAWLHLIAYGFVRNWITINQPTSTLECKGSPLKSLDDSADYPLNLLSFFKSCELTTPQFGQLRIVPYFVKCSFLMLLYFANKAVRLTPFTTAAYSILTGLADNAIQSLNSTVLGFVAPYSLAVFAH